jgi:hypothetical protein
MRVGKHMLDTLCAASLQQMYADPCAKRNLQLARVMLAAAGPAVELLFLQQAGVATVHLRGRCTDHDQHFSVQDTDWPLCLMYMVGSWRCDATAGDVLLPGRPAFALRCAHVPPVTNADSARQISVLASQAE